MERGKHTTVSRYLKNMYRLDKKGKFLYIYNLYSGFNSTGWYLMDAVRFEK